MEDTSVHASHLSVSRWLQYLAKGFRPDISISLWDNLNSDRILPPSWRWFESDICCLWDETELHDRCYPTSSPKNCSNSQFVVFTNLHLFYLTWLIFCSSVCDQSWKTGKITLHDMHTIKLLSLLSIYLPCISGLFQCEAGLSSKLCEK